ncbi:hypothetical protein PROFUN_16890 [Planoprotostelium fungivorum]|uniref:Uncharacterized protein n=1 Tax=Planoprotostelium fungivorum TaxID=1890364 RepID=A0A2P6MNK2_9EUKA|nr:hypothetical protein PROFUN_16890 [Planoprotostelium fungivorum]
MGLQCRANHKANANLMKKREHKANERRVFSVYFPTMSNRHFHFTIDPRLSRSDYLHSCYQLYPSRHSSLRYRRPSIPVPFCYYSFDNGLLNSLLKDDSGNGKVASVLGLPSVIVGKTKQALGFNSTSGFQGLRMDQTAGLDGAFSIASWLKVQASNKVMKIVSVSSVFIQDDLCEITIW